MPRKGSLTQESENGSSSSVERTAPPLAFLEFTASSEFAELPAAWRWTAPARPPTESAARRLDWCLRFLQLLAERSFAGSIAQLPRTEEPGPAAATGDAAAAPPHAMPLAALVIWRRDRIDAAAGIAHVLALAEPGLARIQARIPLTKDAPGQTVPPDAFSNFDGGEVELTLRDGTDAPYLGYLFYAGQFLIAASPRIPRTACDLADLFLPDLQVLDTAPGEWSALAAPSQRENPAPRKRSQTPQPLPAQLKFPADRIHKGAIEALSMVDQWQRFEGFHIAHAASGAQEEDFAMLCGFATDPGKEIWNFLMTKGEAAIKAHYALWARLYEQTGGQSGQYAVMNINQFCADLGYKPHHKGGFKRERKQEAMRLLETLTSVEVAVRFRVAGKTARVRELSGALWKRGFQARERDEYGDLFGKVREGDPDLWDPAGFSYGPGPWFDDPVWRKQNEFLGLIGVGLMKLQTDTDQTAIRIGGYLGALARFDQYRTRRIRVATLLERIGMAKRYPKDPQRLQEAVEQALRKLVDVRVIARWDYTNAEPSEPDMDDPEELRTLAEFTRHPWRQKTIEIEWPATLVARATRFERPTPRASTADTKTLPPSRSKKRTSEA